jgi:S-adenosylmethionine synthetase
MDECLVQLSYCIGLVDPVSVMVNSFGTSKIPEKALARLVRQVFPLSPKGMIDHLNSSPAYLPQYRGIRPFRADPSFPGNGWI